VSSDRGGVDFEAIVPDGRALRLAFDVYGIELRASGEGTAFRSSVPLDDLHLRGDKKLRFLALKAPVEVRLP
jgi:hypothetical protein